LLPKLVCRPSKKKRGLSLVGVIQPRGISASIGAATENIGTHEYLAPKLRIKIRFVDMEEAIAHINQVGSTSIPMPLCPCRTTQ